MPLYQTFVLVMRIKNRSADHDVDSTKKQRKWSALLLLMRNASCICTCCSALRGGGVQDVYKAPRARARPTFRDRALRLCAHSNRSIPSERLRCTHSLAPGKNACSPKHPMPSKGKSSAFFFKPSRPLPRLSPTAIAMPPQKIRIPALGLDNPPEDMAASYASPIVDA